jgi:hypothetical protein
VKDSSEEENDWWPDAAAITEQEEDAMRKGFAEAVKNMVEWAKAHTAKVHHSGPVADQSVLSRLIAFQTEDGGFSWTRKRKAVAWRMYNQPNQTPETICEALGCSVNMFQFSSHPGCPWWCQESLTKIISNEQRETLDAEETTDAGTKCGRSRNAPFGQGNACVAISRQHGSDGRKK